MNTIEVIIDGKKFNLDVTKAKASRVLKPKMRRIKNEDVPDGALVRYKDTNNKYDYFIAQPKRADHPNARYIKLTGEANGEVSPKVFISVLGFYPEYVYEFYDTKRFTWVSEVEDN